MKNKLIQILKKNRENIKRQKKWKLCNNTIFSKDSFVDEKTILEGSNIISPEVRLYNSNIGFATYFGRGSIVNFTKIGRYCSVDPRFRIMAGRHPTDTFVSTFLAFYSIQKKGFTYTGRQLFDELKYVDEEKNIL